MRKFAGFGIMILSAYEKGCHILKNHLQGPIVTPENRAQRNGQKEDVVATGSHNASSNQPRYADEAPRRQRRTERFADRRGALEEEIPAKRRATSRPEETHAVPSMELSRQAVPVTTNRVAAKQPPPLNTKSTRASSHSLDRPKAKDVSPKATLEKSRSHQYNDVYDEDDVYDDDDMSKFDDDFGVEAHRTRKGLIVFLSLVLVLCLGIGAAWMFLPGAKDTIHDMTDTVSTWVSGLLTTSSTPDLSKLQIVSIEVNPSEAVVGDTVQIVIHTSSGVGRIRVQDMYNQLISEGKGGENNILVNRIDDVNPDSPLRWQINHIFDAPYDGIVSAWMGTDDAWLAERPASAKITVISQEQKHMQEEAKATPGPTAVLEPTLVPTKVPSPTPMSTPTPAPSPTPTPTPVPYTISEVQPVEDVLPSKINLTTSVIVNNGEIAEGFARSYGPDDQRVFMGDPDLYGARIGVLTHRMGPQRQNAAFGTAEVKDKTLEVVWTAKTASNGSIGGIGWTGQPLLVRWPQEAREMMNIISEKKENKELVEGIYPTRDGKIYFFDVADGTWTRDPIDAGMPFEGTPAIDPRGVPVLFAGQGIAKEKTEAGQIGMRIFSLIDQSQLFYEDGRNSLATIQEGAVHGSPIMEPNSKTLIYGGENGLLYTISLGTKLNKTDGVITMDPKVTAYKYSVAKNKDFSIKGSVAVYGNYVYFADGAGFLQCVDMETMQCVWITKVKDSTDAAIALEETKDGGVALYTGTTVRIQAAEGKSFLRRYDALTGTLVWEHEEKVNYNRNDFRNGAGSPIVGQGNIDDLIIFTVDKVPTYTSIVVALNKETGEEEWEQPLDVSTWSSPLAIYTPEGEAYIVQGDKAGTLRLLDGFTGSLLDTETLNGPIDGSPAAYKDMIVVGTTENRIYGIRIR